MKLLLYLYLLLPLITVAQSSSNYGTCGGQINNSASYTTSVTPTSIIACNQSTVQYNITAQSGSLLFNNPTGVWEWNQQLQILITDNGSPSSLSFDTKYKEGAFPLPTVTVSSVIMRMLFYYNASTGNFDLVTLTGIPAETDPIWTASASYGILGSDITNWNSKGSGSVTSVSAGAGLSGGTWTTAGTVSMPNVGTAATWGSANTMIAITTDAQGRVSGVTQYAIPTWNQNTSGTSANVTGVVASANIGSLAGGQVGLTGLSATGTPSGTTYLRGDNTWASIVGGGTVTSVTSANTTYATVANSTTTPAITIVASPLEDVTSVTTNSTFYPTFVTTGSGQQALKTSTTNLTYNPSTGVLTTPTVTATTFNGALNGNASTATNIDASGLTGTTIASGVTGSSLTSFGTSPSLVTPALGTPASGTLTNCTFPTLNQNSTGTANIAGGTVGAVPYQSAANTTGVVAATSTANKPLMSGASAIPVWSTPTYPNATATSRKMIVGDGTNFVMSTETWAVPGTSTNLLQSDGTNWTSVTIPTWNQNTTGQANTALLTTSVTVTNNTGSSPIYLNFTTGTGGSYPIQTATAAISYVPSSGALTTASFVGTLNGNAATATSATSSTTAATATNANNEAITNTTSNTTYYPTMVTTAGGNQALFSASTALTYNPSTGVLTTPTVTATTFNGTLSGNATSATTATNSSNTAITDDGSTNTTMFPTWVTTSSGNQAQKTSSAVLTYNPSSGNLSATTFTGALSGNASTATTATNSNNEAISNVTTNATMYPTFVAAGSGGNQALKTSSVNLTFNPTTGALSTPTVIATTFTGALSGNATTATTATNSNNEAITNVTTNAIVYPTFVSAGSSGNQALQTSSVNLTFNPSTGALSSPTVIATTFTGALTGTASGNASATLNSALMYIGNASNVATGTAVTGDWGISNTGVATLATVNSNTGNWGSATQTPTITVDGKGRITAVGNVAITGFASSTLTNGNIYIGNGSNIATSVTASGDWTVSNTGVATLKSVGTAGTWGSSNTLISITTDGQGRVSGTTSYAIPIWNQSTTGQANTALLTTSVTTTDNSGATVVYPNFTTGTGGSYPILTNTANISYVPSTGALTTKTVIATTFTGALAGNASTSTTATNSNNSAITNTTTAATFYPTFVSAGGGNQAIQTASTVLTYNPNTGALTTTSVVATLNGNASTATTATTATNVTGGAAGSLVYQSGAATTTVLAIGAQQQVPTVNVGTTSYTWASPEVLLVSTTASAGGINTSETVLVKTPAMSANALLQTTVIKGVLTGTCTASVANTSTFTVRIGTAGTTSDGAVATFVCGASASSGTAVAFKVVIELTILTVGSSASIGGVINLINNGVTGISTVNSQVVFPTAATFNSTTANNIISITYKSAASTTTSGFRPPMYITRKN